ncbi:MAG: hypothetical protein ACMXX9_04365 [Candidatus Woesearchaeota archaeon]
MIKLKKITDKADYINNFEVNSLIRGDDVYIDTFYLVNKGFPVEVRITLANLKPDAPNDYLFSEREHNGKYSLDIFREPGDIKNMLNSYINLNNSQGNYEIGAGSFNYKEDIIFLDKELDISRDVSWYDCNDMTGELFKYSGFSVRDVKEGHVFNKLKELKKKYV